MEITNQTIKNIINDYLENINNGIQPEKLW